MAAKESKKKNLKKPNALSNTLARKKTKRKPNKKEKIKGTKKRKSGPRLPQSFIKELDLLNPNPKTSDSESDGGEDEYEMKVKGDIYEYVDEIPQEESKKNRRFDPVENYEYELPEDFKDEDVPSDDEDVPSDDEDIPSDQSDAEDDDGDKQLRMLEGITGMPRQAFDGKEKKQVILTDLQGDLDGGKISINDLLDPLHGKAGYSKLRKRLHQLEKNPVTVQPPLPEAHRKMLERKSVNERLKKNITKWEPLVKRNREAPTLYFQEDVNVGVSTVGAIASEFEPRTEFEKKMAALVRDPEVAEAHWKDGAKLLELNKVSVQDVRERQNQLAKMRSLLFRHEMKQKHIKKIKSKTYHRKLKKEKLKAASAVAEMDPEAAKELAVKQEFKRAEERMTLKHKNSSKWARRILERGLQVQDEGTRAAISEQLHQHALLTRKMNSMKDGSSSDESSDDDDDDDELAPGEEHDKVSQLLNRAKEKTMKVINEEDEIPKSGVLALPFMERGLKKRKEAAEEEARIALQEYDSLLQCLEDGDETECSKSDKPSGRRVFGEAQKKAEQPNKRVKTYDSRNSDSEDGFETAECEDGQEQEMKNDEEDFKIGSSVLDESDVGQKALFKSFDDIVKDPGPETTYDVAIFASGTWKKMNGEKLHEKNRKSEAVSDPAPPTQDTKLLDQNSDSDSEIEMVDGILSSESKRDYELPSQADLVHRAFAGDDVEEEFEKDKMEVLNEENPEPEKPVLLPGWGQWTHIQQKRGPPSWMLEEHEKAKRKREEALKKRKDSNLKHVIISEKIDKKAEKLHATTLPFPYKSKDVYEQSIRMPLGPEYNPAISVGALNRPAVVKKAGTIIKPIKYEEVDPYNKEDQHNHGGHKKQTKKPKFTRGGPLKKT